jgi:hypothetical protein
MTTPDRPLIHCQHLPTFNRDTWDSNVEALRQAQPCPLRQAWLTAPQKELLPATVRTGWTDTDLIVFAELEDRDIFNPVTELNALSFRYGDVFEMFLRPEEQAAYCEFHVTPQNQKLQVRFPSSEALLEPRTADGIPSSWLIFDRQFDSQVHVNTAANRWAVLAAIPFDMVADSGRAGAGSRWLFSFSRYDYTRNQPAPVLSSTSPHRELNYHRQQEWGTLLFV